MDLTALIITITMLKVIMKSLNEVIYLAWTVAQRKGSREPPEESSPLQSIVSRKDRAQEFSN